MQSLPILSIPFALAMVAPHLDGSRCVARDVELTAGNATLVDLHPKPPRGQRVVLTDPSGRPLANWRIGWSQRTSATDGTWRQVGTAMTDAQGQARSNPLANGTVRIFARSSSERDLIARVVAEVAANTPEVRVALQLEQMPCAEVVGRVLSAQGDPLAGARVEWTTDDGAIVTTPTDQNGCFAVGPTAAMPLRARIHAADHAPHDLGTVQLVRHHLVDLGDLTLPAPARILVRATGAEIDVASLRFALGEPGRPTPHAGFTPAPGGHLSPPLNAGAYVLYVHGPEVHPIARPVQVALGEAVTIDVELTRAPRLTCSLTFGKPADGIARGTFRIVDSRGLALVHEAVSGDAAQRGAQQLHRHLGLVPGRYTIEAQRQGGRTVRREIEMLAQGVGSPLALDLR